MNFGILSIVGIVLFLYLTWRNLRDNYQEAYLIPYSWMALLAFWLGAKYINYVGGYFGLLAITYIICKNNSWKFWPFLEDIIGNIGILIISMLANELIFIKFNLQIVLIILVLIISLVVNVFVEKKYRSFVWYKSGKKGFSFFFVNFLVWLLLSGVFFFLGNNKIYFYLCLVASLISLVGLFILGEVIKSLLVFEKGRK